MPASLLVFGVETEKREEWWNEYRKQKFTNATPFLSRQQTESGEPFFTILTWERGSIQIAVIFHRNWAQTFPRVMRAAITASAFQETPGLIVSNCFFCWDLFLRGTWLDGAGDEAVGFTPTALSRAQRCSTSSPGAGGKGGGRQAMGEGIVCAPQLKLVTSSRTSERDILPNVGLEHTLPANTVSYENDNGWNLWGFDFYFIGCVCCTPAA